MGNNGVLTPFLGPLFKNLDVGKIISNVMANYGSETIEDASKSQQCAESSQQSQTQSPP